MVSNSDRALVLGFVEEVRGYLPQILRAAGAMPHMADYGSALELGYRYLHTIKGAASMLGLTSLARCAYAAEELLEDIAAGVVEPSERSTELLVEAVDQFAVYLDRVESGQEAEGSDSLVSAARAIRVFAGKESPDGDKVPELPGEQLAPDRWLDQSNSNEEEREATDDLIDAFRLEAEDLLQAAGARLRDIQLYPPATAGARRAALQAIRRCIHTLKGAASMVGFRAISQLAHRMEDLLDELFERSISPSADQLGLLFDTMDVLEDLAKGEPGDSSALEEQIFSRYAQWSAGAGSVDREGTAKEGSEVEAALEVPSAFMGSTYPAAPRDSGSVVRVSLVQLDELVRLVSELLVQRSTFEQYQNALVRQIGELSLALNRQKGVTTRLEKGIETRTLVGDAAFTKTSPSGNSSSVFSPVTADFDELELDRYSEFHLLSRALVETTSDLGTIFQEQRNISTDLEGALDRIGQLTTETQDKLMRLRLVPLDTLASRLHRAVRVTARDRGKSAELWIEGQGVELDKGVIEEIAGSLLHLVRNAVDHGIEAPSLRRERGKSEKGTIKVGARYEGTEILIEVSDDGGGINLVAVRARAVELGLKSEQEAEAMAPDDLYEMLLLPGFSTAASLSVVSGRGIGMDVVKAAVQKLKGNLTVTSRAGEGTCFQVRLPMTLAITRAILVRSRGQEFAIPLANVSRILRVEREKIQTMGTSRVLELDGQACPLVELAEIFNLEEAPEEQLRKFPVLILSAGSRRLGLAVDRLAEAREIVVKNLGSLIRKIKGVAGATLLGDGRVVPILNSIDFFPSDQYVTEQASPSWSSVRTRDSQARALNRPLEALIVDDSLSVRRVLAHLVRSSGWIAHQAKDGIEALEALHRLPQTPDVVLLDIEMPRMDGFELLQALRNQPAYRELPVVMITSRSGPKHRQRAFDLGASDYLVKPYQPEALISAIQRLTRSAGNRHLGV